MIKKHKIIEANHIDLYCDKCGKKMTRGSVAYMSYPVQYSYKCECGNEITSTLCFPFQQISYELEGVEITTEEATRGAQ